MAYSKEGKPTHTAGVQPLLDRLPGRLQFYFLLLHFALGSFFQIKANLVCPFCLHLEIPPLLWCCSPTAALFCSCRGTRGTVVLSWALWSLLHFQQHPLSHSRMEFTHRWNSLGVHHAKAHLSQNPLSLCQRPSRRPCSTTVPGVFHTLTLLSPIFVPHRLCFWLARLLWSTSRDWMCRIGN